MSTNVLATIERAVREEQGFSPDKLKLQSIIALSRELPEDTSDITGEHAEYLAGKFLNGIDLCGELYSMAVAFELKKEVLKKKSFGEAMLIRGQEKNFKTAKEKEMYAFTDEEYIEAADNLIKARMFRQVVEEKKSAFEKAHYLMKRIAERDINVGSVKDEISGAGSWEQPSSWK